MDASARARYPQTRTFDRDEFRPDPADRRDEARRRQQQDICRAPAGALQISGQFSRANLLGRIQTNGKRTRKKTKTDKTMSKALAQANKELRKKNGQYRSGVTQADIMRRAHRIRRKMS